MDSKIEDAAPPSDERKCYNCGQVKNSAVLFLLLIVSQLSYLNLYIYINFYHSLVTFLVIVPCLARKGPLVLVGNTRIVVLLVAASIVVGTYCRSFLYISFLMDSIKESEILNLSMFFFEL
jgi:hypothetical protein